jgi:hypothetical protein
LTTDTLGFSTAGAQKMIINSSGNVSIGNTNDTFKLDVSGTFRATGAITGSSFSGAGTGLTGTASSLSIGGDAGTVGGYSASNFLGKNGNTYYQVDTWLQLNGVHGLYAPGTNGAHFYPNNSSSYTTWTISGNRGGYGGIYDGYSAVAGFMYDSAGNGGVYRETSGRWYWYYHLSNSSMGINSSTTSASYGLYVTGAIYSTSDIVAYSDIRKKTDIVTIDKALDKVMAMRGVFYTKIDDINKGRQIGVIAQEINEVLPEVVTYAADVDEYGVKYGNIVGVLIEAIKELNEEIKILKNNAFTK